MRSWSYLSSYLEFRNPISEFRIIPHLLEFKL